MEGFFSIGSQIDEIEIKELLLRRYHSLDFINTMKLDEFCDFLILAINNDKKDKVYLQYLALLPSFVQTNKYMSFDDFYDNYTGKNIDLRPAEEILKEAEEIQKRFRENENGSGNL